MDIAGVFYFTGFICENGFMIYFTHLIFRRVSMTLNELFSKDGQPSTDDITEYAGNFKPVWVDLLAYFESA